MENEYKQLIKRAEKAIAAVEQVQQKQANKNLLPKDRTAGADDVLRPSERRRMQKHHNGRTPDLLLKLAPMEYTP